MSKEYSVLVLARPTVPIKFIGPLPPKYKFHIKGSSGVKEIVLNNIEAPDLHFIVHTTNDCINDAIEEATPQVRGIVSNLVYLLSSRIPIIYPITAWEPNPVLKGEFVQFVSPVIVKNPEKHPLEVKNISRLLEILNAREEEITYQFTRAVRWYRNSLLTDSPIEKLIFLWIGFEAIDPLLCKLLQIKPEPMVCSECKHEYGTKTNMGIKTWIEKLQRQKSIPSKPSFNDIRSSRGRLVHAGSKLVKNEKEWISAVELLKPALLLALDEIIAFEIAHLRIVDSIIEREVQVRVDGYVTSQSQKSSSDIPPVFTLQKGPGFIELQPQEPHHWYLPRPFEQFPGSNYEIDIEKLSITHPKSIQPHASLDFS